MVEGHLLRHTYATITVCYLAHVLGLTGGT